jgi:SAM-dependent MidA family methyltransferase
MTLRSPVEQEIRDLIRQHGRITFARFMHACLYSPRGGFYSTRDQRISTHFGTSALSHPVFGSLIARQLEEMWHLLSEPRVFHVIEAGCGDGALARSIVRACSRMAPAFADALCYVAADYAPRTPQPSDTVVEWEDVTANPSLGRTDAKPDVARVKTAGVSAFGSVVGCILSNELLDNFPVHRFIVQDGRVKEVFVTLTGGNFTELADEPSSPRIADIVESLGVSLPEGYRGEVNLALEEWTREVSRALDRGFVLTIDYGEQAGALYSAEHEQGTLTCYRRHEAGHDPYRHIGEQDITSHVDFTWLARLGERHGLATVGYALQREFLTNLGFSSFLDEFDTRGQSPARAELNRIAMRALVDPDDYGDLKVLAQAKGIEPGAGLLGFAGSQGVNLESSKRLP